MLKKRFINFSTFQERSQSINKESLFILFSIAQGFAVTNASIVLLSTFIHIGNGGLYDLENYLKLACLGASLMYVVIVYETLISYSLIINYLPTLRDTFIGFIFILFEYLLFAFIETDIYQVPRVASIFEIDTHYYWFLILSCSSFASSFNIGEGLKVVNDLSSNKLSYKEWRLMKLIKKDLIKVISDSGGGGKLNLIFFILIGGLDLLSKHSDTYYVIFTSHNTVKIVALILAILNFILLYNSLKNHYVEFRTEINKLI